MTYFYRQVMLLMAPLFVLRLLWKARRAPAYRERILERFSFAFASKQPADVWVHAVSLGEVNAAAPLINDLLSQSLRIVVTTMTPTGAAQVKKVWGERLTHQYVPYESMYCVRRFLKHYRPRLGLIMETELWPVLLKGAHSCAIPLYLINGRLSAQSYRGYRYIKPLIRSLFRAFTHICVQTEEDAHRFSQLGAKAEQIKVMGNLKFDLAIQTKTQNPIEGLKKKWGANRAVLILASTHEGEELLFLQAMKALQELDESLLLLIAPRHPERFDTVFQLAQKMGLNTARRTQAEGLSASTQVLVMDSLGELLSAYAMSDYAFVGGSFVPTGGHNVLEPIAVGVPVFTGPHVHNFKAICKTLSDEKAIQIVKDMDEFISCFKLMLEDSLIATRQAAIASGILERNRGVARRYSVEFAQYFG